MDTTLRRPRCRLCREEGHNYRTCSRVETIHTDLLYIFHRIIVNNSILTFEEGMELPCRWIQEYSLIALRALARKHGIRLTHTKEEYCHIFKRLYFTIAFHEIQVIIGDEILRDVILQLINLQEEQTQFSNYRSYWIQAMGAFEIPLSLFPIQLNKNEDLIEFDCPICFETIEQDEHKIKINCGHRICEPCMYSYLTTLLNNINNQETVESCTPKCPLCRAVIFNIDGDVAILNTKFKDHLSFV